MLCRYLNGASFLAACRCSVNSTPRRLSDFGIFHGAGGISRSIFGNRSSPGGLEFGDDHKSASPREGRIMRWISSQILPLVVRAGLNEILGD